MSGSTTTAPAAPLTDAERTSVRRFCGYPAYGSGSSGFQSWRFFTAYGVLEFKLGAMSDAELIQTRTYVTQLASLELAILTSTTQLDVGSAPAYVRNPEAMNERRRIYADWRGMLCNFLGVPPGPEMPGAQAGRIII